MNRKDDIVERVDRGAAWLDKVKPNWCQPWLLTNGLEMCSCKRCVLGKIYGDFSEAPFPPEVTNSVKKCEWATYHGFERSELGDFVEYGRLEDAWIKLIRKRLHEAGMADAEASG